MTKKTIMSEKIDEALLENEIILKRVFISENGYKELVSSLEKWLPNVNSPDCIKVSAKKIQKEIENTKIGFQLHREFLEILGQEINNISKESENYIKGEKEIRDKKIVRIKNEIQILRKRLEIVKKREDEELKIDKMIANMKKGIKLCREDKRTDFPPLPLKKHEMKSELQSVELKLETEKLRTQRIKNIKKIKLDWFSETSAYYKKSLRALEANENLQGDKNLDANLSDQDSDESGEGADRKDKDKKQQVNIKTNQKEESKEIEIDINTNKKEEIINTDISHDMDLNNDTIMSNNDQSLSSVSNSTTNDLKSDLNDSQTNSGLNTPLQDDKMDLS